jgi:hypothetical protein
MPITGLSFHKIMATESGPERLCRRCQHFVVTWIPARPYACRAFGFKGRVLPCVTVFENSGVTCQLFTPRTRKDGSKPDPKASLL